MFSIGRFPSGSSVLAVFSVVNCIERWLSGRSALRQFSLRSLYPLW